MGNMRLCHCGNELLKRQKNTCSRDCQYELYRQRGKGKNEINIICSNCGNKFKKKKYMIQERSKNYYCNVKCSDEHKKVTMIGNKNFNNTDEHYKKLSKIMKEKWANDKEYRKKVTKNGFGSLRTCVAAGKASNTKKSIKKRENTLKKRYGVTHNFNIPEVRRNILIKSHQTMKKNGTYGKSKIEDAFYCTLCKIFTKKDVDRQITLSENNWSIDFYIKSIDTYIQFDGVYWHGLNRPIKEIKESKNPRDEKILKTYYRDIEQNRWCNENNIKLIRITDVEYSASTQSEIKEKITNG